MASGSGYLSQTSDDVALLEFRARDDKSIPHHEPESHTRLGVFQRNGKWIDPSSLRLYQAIELAVFHPLYESSLRKYFYLGLAEDKKTGDAYLAFITEKTSGGKGPPSRGRGWAVESLAVYPYPENVVKYLNPTEIVLLEHPEPEVYIWDHPELYDNLCQYSLVEGQSLAALEDETEMMLRRGLARKGADNCHDKKCPFLARLRDAMRQQRLHRKRANLQPGGGVREGLVSPVTHGKVIPSGGLCDFTTGPGVVVFVPSKHRLDQFTARTDNTTSRT